MQSPTEYRQLNEILISPGEDTDENQSEDTNEEHETETGYNENSDNEDENENSDDEGEGEGDIKGKQPADTEEQPNEKRAKFCWWGNRWDATSLNPSYSPNTDAWVKMSGRRSFALISYQGWFSTLNESIQQELIRQLEE